MTEEEEWKKLPAEERCQHKSYKARMDGFAELCKIFPKLDEKDAQWNKYVHVMRKGVSDSNAFAQDRALDATLEFVSSAFCAGKVVADVASGIVAKCLGGKAKTREKAFDILLMIIEIEKQEPVIEVLMNGLEHKSPKIIAACLDALKAAMTAFGNKIIAAKPLTKAIPPLFSHKDKVVRESSRALAGEIFRWLRNVVKPALSMNVPPIVIKELQSEWDEIESQPSARPTRYIRSQQEAAAAEAEREESSADVGAGDRVEAVEEVDAYDFAEPVEVLSKIPSDFYSDLEEKKWQTRKEALAKILPLVSVPKLASGDYGDLVRALKKRIAKDNNVMIVEPAAQVLTAVALGLRLKFTPYTTQILSALLERLKEKRPAVLEALRAATDATLAVCKLDAVLEDLVAALDNKSPNIKSETSRALARFIAVKKGDLGKANVKALLPVLVKRLDDSLGDVRDAASECVAALWRKCGERAVTSHLQEIDKNRYSKIQELATVKTIDSEKKSPPPVKKEQPKKSDPLPAAKKVPPSKKVEKKPIKKQQPKKSEPEDEKDLSDEQINEIALRIFGEETLENLNSNAWKQRLAAVESMHSALSKLEASEIPAQVFAKLLAGPGNKWKESNFNVLRERLATFRDVANSSKIFSKVAASSTSVIGDKTADVKCGELAKEALLMISERVGFGWVVEEVSSAILENGHNPKSQISILSWLSKALTEFGPTGVDMKILIKRVRSCLSATNAQVRQSAVNLIAVMYLYTGPVLRQLLESEKPAVVALIDAEIENAKGKKPPAPTRRLRGVNDEQTEEAEDEDEPDAPTDALVDRVDVSDKITESIISSLSDKNWKIRGEALDNVHSIINEAKFVKPNLGELPAALALRLNDNNKLLVTKTAEIWLLLGTALGSGCKSIVKSLVPAIYLVFADVKPQVRAAGRSAIDCWVEHCGITPFLENEAVYTVLTGKKCSPCLKQELYNWLAAQLAVIPPKKVPLDELVKCLPPLFGSLDDRNPDVRTAAQNALRLFAGQLTFEKCLISANKQNNKTAIAVLEKIRESVPNLRPAKKLPPAPPVELEATTVELTLDDAQSQEVKQVSDDSKKPLSKKTIAKGSVKKGIPSKASKKESEENEGPLLTIGRAKDSKEQRAKDEANHKLLKWNFNTPMKEHVAQLKDLFQSVSSPTLHTYLFHTDFKKHLLAISQLTEFLPSNPKECVANVDLLLKWIAIHLFDTNTTVAYKLLDLGAIICSVLTQENYSFSDSEASSFFPYLVNRIGDPKDEIRKKVHAIMNEASPLYPHAKLFAFLMDGLKSKNSRSRAECLEGMTSLVDNIGTSVCLPSVQKVTKEVAQVIADKDSSARNAALTFVVTVMGLSGEEVVRKWLTFLSDKEMSMLDERFKRVNKKNVARRQTVQPAASNDMVGSSHLITMNTLSRTNPTARQSLSASMDNSMPPPSGPRTYRNRVAVKPYFTIDFDSFEADRDDPRPFPKSNTASLDIVHEPTPTYEIKTVIQSSPALTAKGGCGNVIDLIVSQLTSQEPGQCLVALRQLDNIITDDEHHDVLMGHIDQFYLNCAVHLRMYGCSNMTAIQGMFQCLISSLDRENLASQVSPNTLQDLIITLCTHLKDSNDRNTIITLCNKYLQKACDKCNFITVTCSLIGLLQSSIENRNLACFADPFSKYLRRMIRIIPSVVDDLILDWTALYSRIGQFMSSIPRSPDTKIYYRTLSSIIYEIVKFRGRTLLATLNKTLCSNGANPDLHNTVRTCVKKVESSHTGKSVMELRNQQLQSIIGQCKAATNCKEIVHSTNALLSFAATNKLDHLESTLKCLHPIVADIVRQCLGDAVMLKTFQQLATIEDFSPHTKEEAIKQCNEVRKLFGLDGIISLEEDEPLSNPIENIIGDPVPLDVPTIEVDEPTSIKGPSKDVNDLRRRLNMIKKRSSVLAR